jgi:hypothetical protein
MIQRRKPLKRSAKPIKKRRSKPRRGVVKDVPFREWVRERNCIIERGTSQNAKEHLCDTAPTIHHVRFCGSPKNDRRVLAICASGHLHGFGKNSIEHGKEQWERYWGLDIEAEITLQQEEYERNGG